MKFVFPVSELCKPCVLLLYGAETHSVTEVNRKYFKAFHYEKTNECNVEG